MASCPMCTGQSEFLGALGNTKHYRCVQCGWIWGRQPRKPKRSRSKAKGAK